MPAVGSLVLCLLLVRQPTPEGRLQHNIWC